jgi:hypothetical protein
MIAKRKKTAAPTAEVGLQGRRFDAAQKHHALTLIASGVAREQVAATIGTTTQFQDAWVSKDAVVAGSNAGLRDAYGALTSAAPSRGGTCGRTRRSRGRNGRG